MPAGPWNWLVERGQVKAGPLIEHTGNGETVKWTSLVSVQPLDWTTVKRRVAVVEDTWAVVVKESVASMSAVPLTMLQVVEAIGWRPAVAMPCRGKAVESPSIQRAWSGPASELGPILNVYWMGSMKSSMVAVSD